VANGIQARSYGRVFNAVADEYDRHRPAYPEALIDRACETAGLAAGARVLEIGCGTGQLTRGLLARGLRVMAVEPGERLIARARERLAGAGEVQFLNARLEEASLPRGHYRAVFSASAIHWVDPEVSWGKLEDAHSQDDQQALRAVLARIAPELASEWPTYRDLDRMLAGAAQRHENVSQAWAWLGSYDVARTYVCELFEDAQLAAMPIVVEQTADSLNALLGTMSFWGRLSPRQRDALRAENHALHQRLGRPIRSSAVACSLTARRVPRS
jgi:SAM-dependent methyltransferase